MGARLEREWFFNPDTGEILGGFKSAFLGERKPTIHYQLHPETKITRMGWQAWKNNQPLQMEYKGFILFADPDNPEKVDVDKIEVGL